MRAVRAMARSFRAARAAAACPAAHRYAAGLLADRCCAAAAARRGLARVPLRRRGGGAAAAGGDGAAAAAPGPAGGSGAAGLSAASEAVTRAMLGGAGALVGAGLPPGAVAAFAAAADAAGGPGALEPTCVRCRIEALPGDTAEQLTDVLLGFGAQSVVVEEYRAPGAAEQEVRAAGPPRAHPRPPCCQSCTTRAPLPHAHTRTNKPPRKKTLACGRQVFGAEGGLWDSCSVIAHFGLGHDVGAALAAAWDILGDEAGGAPAAGGNGGDGGGAAIGWRYTLEDVANEEWIEQIKASYVPLQVNEAVWIIPTWSQPVDAGAVNITLEPGVAFGTGAGARAVGPPARCGPARVWCCSQTTHEQQTAPGEHPTTRLCLEHIWAMREELKGKSVRGRWGGRLTQPPARRSRAAAPVARGMPSSSALVVLPCQPLAALLGKQAPKSNF